MVKPWPTVSSAVVIDLGLLRVRRDRARSPRTGAEHDFLVIDMADWLQVVPVTADGRLVMVHQYRHGNRRVGLEFPGGLVEAGDQDHASAARRECLEETGYGGGSLQPLGRFSPQPALFANTVHVFRVDGVTPQAAVDPDPGEDLGVELIAVDELPARIGSGEIHNAVTLAVLALAGPWGQG
jgi:8-oxo-dGTP pyrophosphatase MutT (NUDIX family)